jgi:hypothetical protein
MSHLVKSTGTYSEYIIETCLHEKYFTSTAVDISFKDKTLRMRMQIRIL